MNTEQYLELEFKYRIPKIKYHVNEDLKDLGETFKIEYIDHYFLKNKKEILRIREQPECNLEMTYKKLIGKKNVIRKEINIETVEDTTLESVYKLYEALGYKFNFKNINEAYLCITKDFTIALNKVKSQGFKTDYFIEVEATDGRLTTLDRGDQILKQIYALTEKDREYKSMFQIYAR